MHKFFVYIACTLLLSSSLKAQVTVVNALDGSPIPGVTVRMQPEGKKAGYLASAADGALALPGDFRGILRFSAVGFQTRTDTITKQLPATVALQPMTFAIDPAVVTGQYDPVSRADAVQKISVISRRDIDRIGAVTLRDVLQTQSTLNIVQDGQLGAQMNMLGLSGRHIQILIDGVPVIGRLDGNIDLDQLPLNNVVRIEVIEGPMSVEFGSEAVAGTINLITKDPNAQKSVNVHAMTETVVRYTSGANLRLPFGKWALNASATRLLFNGFSPEENGRVLLWKPKEQLNGQLALSRNFGKLNARVSSFWLHETLWNEGAIQYDPYTEQLNDSTLAVFERPFARDETFITGRLNLRGDVNGKVGARGGLEGFVAFDRFSRQSENVIKDLSTLESLPVNDSEANDTAVFVSIQSRFSYRHSLSDRATLSLGYDIKTERAEGKRIEDKRREISDYALFATAEIKAARNFTVRPGLRVIENTRYNAPLIPSLHLKWGPGNTVIRASYGRGFRAPELKELHFLFVDSNHNIRGNDLLEAEVSDSYQLSFEYNALRGDRLWQPSVTFFYNDVRNLIDLALVDEETQLYEYTNLGNVNTRGVNAGISVKEERWVVDARGSFILAENRFSSELTVENRILQGALSAEYRVKKLNTAFNLQANIFGRQPQNRVNEEGQVSQFELAPYSMLSLFVHQPLLKQRLRLSAGCENLLDVSFRNSAGAAASGGAHSSGATQLPVALGRLFRLSVQYEFVK